MTALSYLKEYPFAMTKDSRATTLLTKDNKAVIRLNHYDSEEQRIRLHAITSKYGDLEDYHLCGYVALPKSEIPKEWWGNYDADALQYLAVHGGITYATESGDHVLFGLDCAHAGDEKNPEMFDPEHVMKLVEEMEVELLAYAKIIKEWRAADTETRAKMLDVIRNGSAEFGFGAMIDMLGGAESVKKP